MEWIAQPETWISLLTLTLLEIVLGIDNIVFISILAGKLPPEQQPRARSLGLTLALFTRVRNDCGRHWRNGRRGRFEREPLAIVLQCAGEWPEDLHSAGHAVFRVNLFHFFNL